MATVTYGPSAALVQLQVPDGVTSLAYDVAGGSGVAVTSYEVGAGQALEGGRGARIKGVLAVTGGQILWISVGGQGLPSGRATTPSGLGGAGVAAGAATLIGTGAVSVENALVVAGGGGAGGEDGAGGSGGGIGGRASGTGGGGLGGGQDATWTDPDGENTTVDGCGGGGGGLRGGRAGTVADGKRGGGGGGSSKVPSGSTITSDWTGPGSVSLTYGAAPLAPTKVTPASGAAIPAGRPFEVTWDFVGAITGDRQGSATATVTSGGGTFTRSLTGEGEVLVFPAEAAAAGAAQVSVTTAQRSGAVGPSTTTSFSVATPVAAPDITNPATASVSVTSPLVDLQWTATEQAQYRIVRSDPTGTTVYDDTTVTSATTRKVTLTTVNGRSELVRLSVFGTNGVESDPDTVRLAPRFTPPATPTVTLTPDKGTATRAPSLVIAVTRTPVAGRPARVRSSVEVQAIAPAHAVRVEPRHPIVTDTDAAGVTRWRLPSAGVDYQVLVTDYSADGVPAVGASDAGLGGFGVSPWGLGPWGD